MPYYYVNPILLRYGLFCVSIVCIMASVWYC